LLVTLVLMTFACGDSQEERFESARAVVVALQPKRRRPGETLPGFQLALALSQAKPEGLAWVGE
jgi:hypothetical protein